MSATANYRYAHNLLRPRDAQGRFGPGAVSTLERRRLLPGVRERIQPRISAEVARCLTATWSCTTKMTTLYLGMDWPDPPEGDEDMNDAQLNGPVLEAVEAGEVEVKHFTVYEEWSE